MITQDTRNSFSDSADNIVTVPETDTLFESMLAIIPGQLIAYYCAVLRGIDPDKPRTLAKSVTVE